MHCTGATKISRAWLRCAELSGASTAGRSRAPRRACADASPLGPASWYAVETLSGRAFAHAFLQPRYAKLAHDAIRNASTHARTYVRRTSISNANSSLLHIRSRGCSSQRRNSFDTIQRSLPHSGSNGDWAPTRRIGTPLMRWCAMGSRRGSNTPSTGAPAPRPAAPGVRASRRASRPDTRVVLRCDLAQPDASE